MTDQDLLREAAIVIERSACLCSLDPMRWARCDKCLWLAWYKAEMERRKNETTHEIQNENSIPQP